VLGSEVHVWQGELGREASQAALRRVLGRYLGADTAAIEFERGEGGKPRLADPDATLRFNLSHSGGLVLIALAAGREVGVDVERIRPRRNLPRLAERALNPAAAAAVRNAPPAERIAAFHAAWCRREAIAKCHGSGLWRPPPGSPVAVAQLDASVGFAAALAVAGAAIPSVRRFALATGLRDGPGHSRLIPAPR
jgi:4'-phosphopantetheinyl transferase